MCGALPRVDCLHAAPTTVGDDDDEGLAAQMKRQIEAANATRMADGGGDSVGREELQDEEEGDGSECHRCCHTPYVLPYTVLPYTVLPYTVLYANLPICHLTELRVQPFYADRHRGQVTLAG
jgi:hypothetical protein